MKFAIKYIANGRIECDIDGTMYYADGVDDAILKRVVKMKGGRGLNYLKKCCVLRRAQPTVPAGKPLNSMLSILDIGIPITKNRRNHERV